MAGHHSVSGTLARMTGRLRKIVGMVSWPAIAVLTVLAFILGIFGFHENLVEVEEDKTFSLSTLVLLSIQLFVLSSGIQPDPINWKLEFARYAALLCSGSALFKATFTVFGTRIRRALFTRSLGHQIICGYGLKGRQIYDDLLEEKGVVSVVEMELSTDDTEELTARGNFPVLGDATHEGNLIEAGITRASRVFVVCGDDATNVTIATRIARLIEENSNNPEDIIQVHIHIRDPLVYNLLVDSITPAGSPNRKVEFRRFDAWMNAARIHLQNWHPDCRPIPHTSSDRVKSVFMGWSLESESILLHVARICHVANGAKGVAVLAFEGAKAAFDKLIFRFPELTNIIDFQLMDLSLFSPESRRYLLGLAGESGYLTSLYISADNDGDTFELGVTAKSVLSGQDLQVFLRLNLKNGINELLERDAGLPTLKVFGGINPACKASTIVREDLDGMAKLVHRNYLELREKQRQATPKEKWTEKPADKPWEQLAENYREDNRNNADHLEVKLRAVSCLLVRSGDLGSRVPHEFTTEEVEVLAAMEHGRWNASKWLDGWKLGPRNDSLKLHDNLVPYSDLPENIKDYDRDTVRKLPQVYRDFGYSVVKSG